MRRIRGAGRTRWDHGGEAEVVHSDGQVVVRVPPVGWWRGDPHEARQLAYAILNTADDARFGERRAEEQGSQAAALPPLPSPQPVGGPLFASCKLPDSDSKLPCLQIDALNAVDAEERMP
jgi:hypothetical protein